MEKNLAGGNGVSVWYRVVRTRQSPRSAEDPIADTTAAAHTASMFLRRHTKLVGKGDYTYWSLVKSIRTAKGSRQQLVAHLGKLTPEETQRAHEWSDLDALLDGRPPAQQLSLGAPPSPPPAP